ncbi:ATP-binding protein [Neobacillus piezotolerans]|nr:ATP-binding protein [Neobacillus piezotolerans]
MEKHYYRVYKSHGREGKILSYCIPITDTEAELNSGMAWRDRQTLDANLTSLHQKIDEMRALNIAREDTGKLAAGIAHEIRNPLTIVKGFLQLLRPELDELGKGKYASVAIEEINRANKIISEFLSVSKHTSNEKTNTSINQLVKEVILLYESECILKDISLGTSLAKGDFLYMLNASQIKQVLINILKNAMEALESVEHASRREITIFTKTENDAYVIGIQDSGCGIEPETISQLFSPFFSTKPNGNGLGLNICKKIIEEHGASVHVESKVGKGSLFSILFPISVPVCS